MAFGIPITRAKDPMPSGIAKDVFEAKTTASSRWKASNVRCGEGNMVIMMSKMKGKTSKKTQKIWL